MSERTALEVTRVYVRRRVISLSGRISRSRKPGSRLAIAMLETRASLLFRIRDPKDAQAWTQFVQLYAPLLHSYGMKNGLQDADAADLAQDTKGESERRKRKGGKRKGRKRKGTQLFNWIDTAFRQTKSCLPFSSPADPANTKPGT